MVSHGGSSSYLLSASVPYNSALPTRACPQTCRPIVVEGSRRELVTTAGTYFGQMPTSLTALRARREGIHVSRKPGTPHTDDRPLGRRAPIHPTGPRTLRTNIRPSNPSNPLLQTAVASTQRNKCLCCRRRLGQKLLRMHVHPGRSSQLWKQLSRNLLVSL